MEEVKAALFSPPFTFPRYRQGLPRVVGTFWPQRRRHGEEWLHPGRQGDLQEAQEAVRVQERQSVHCNQEATPLPVHQGGFPMVRSCICYTTAMFDSLVIMLVFPQWLRLLSPWQYLRVCQAGRRCEQNLGAVSEWRGGRAFHSWVITTTSPTATRHLECIHTCRHVRRYRKVPSDRCEGGFSPHLAMQTLIRPCGVKPSPDPPARHSPPTTHFDTPVSAPRRPFYLEHDPGCFLNGAFVFQREKLVLILVCAGAGVVVLVAIISAVVAARRAVYRHRWAGEHTCAAHLAFGWPIWCDIAPYRTLLYRFSNLQIQDDENGVTADLASAASSNGTAGPLDSDDVRAV